MSGMAGRTTAAIGLLILSMLWAPAGAADPTCQAAAGAEVCAERAHTEYDGCTDWATHTSCREGQRHDGSISASHGDTAATFDAAGLLLGDDQATNDGCREATRNDWYVGGQLGATVTHGDHTAEGHASALSAHSDFEGENTCTGSAQDAESSFRQAGADLRFADENGQTHAHAAAYQIDWLGYHDANGGPLMVCGVAGGYAYILSDHMPGLPVPPGGSPGGCVPLPI